MIEIFFSFASNSNNSRYLQLHANQQNGTRLRFKLKNNFAISEECSSFFRSKSSSHHISLFRYRITRRMKQQSRANHAEAEGSQVMLFITFHIDCRVAVDGKIWKSVTKIE
jgi:hypothetical protein